MVFGFVALAVLVGLAVIALGVRQMVPQQRRSSLLTLFRPFFVWTTKHTLDTIICLTFGLWFPYQVMLAHNDFLPSGGLLNPK